MDFIGRWIAAGTVGAMFAVASPAGSAYDGLCETAQDVEELPPRHWCEVPNSKLESAEKRPSEFDDYNGSRSAKYDSFQRVMGVRGVTDAWSGAAFDTRRNCLLVFGGGHNDYGGNEVYRFCLDDLRWSRLTDPTPFPNRNPDFKNSDNTPVSRHTYSGLAYIASADRFFVHGGSPDSPSGSCSVEGTWTFNLAARDSQPYSPSQWELRTSTEPTDPSCDDAAAYDPGTGNVIYKSPRGTYTYSFTSNRWAEGSDDGRTSARVNLAVDPVRRLLVEVGGGATALWSIDNRFSGGKVSTSGPKDIENADDPGLAYDIRLDRIVGWHGGTTVYLLDTGTRTWTAVPAADTNVKNPGSVTTQGGVFGRFAYSPALNVYMYVNETNENVMLYRLSDGGPLALPNPPEDLTAN